MKRNGLVLAVWVCILAFAMAVGGCDNPTGEESDTWAAITSLTQINGTWKGSYSQTRTIKEFMEEEGAWDDSMAELLGNMKVTVAIEMTATITAIDASTGTQSTSMKTTQTYSGGNIALVWEMFKLGFEGLEGVTIDNAKHSISMALDIPAQPILLEDQSGLQINQGKTKIKMPAGSIGEDSPEIILYKQ